MRHVGRSWKWPRTTYTNYFVSGGFKVSRNVLLEQPTQTVDSQDTQYRHPLQQLCFLLRSLACLQKTIGIPTPSRKLRSRNVQRAWAAPHHLGGPLFHVDTYSESTAKNRLSAAPRGRPIGTANELCNGAGLQLLRTSGT